jgi:hypothetical protein
LVLLTFFSFCLLLTFFSPFILLSLIRISHSLPEHHTALHEILNSCIRDGISYPYAEEMTLDQFKAYFLASEGFTVSVVKSETFQIGEVVGMFPFYFRYP